MRPAIDCIANMSHLRLELVLAYPQFEAEPKSLCKSDEAARGAGGRVLGLDRRAGRRVGGTMVAPRPFKDGNIVHLIGAVKP